MGDVMERKAALKAKLDSLYGEIAGLEAESLGVEHLSLTSTAANEASAVEGAAAAAVDPDAVAAAPLELAGTALNRQDVRMLQGYVRRLDAWRDHYKSVEDGRGLVVNERHYARALQHLLANQQTQLTERKKHVEELHGRLHDTKQQVRSESETAISDALQTPMQVAADTIIGLIKRLGENSDVAIPLTQVLAQISANDMYQPTVLGDQDELTSPGSQQWISKNFSSGGKSRLERRRGGMVSLEQMQKPKKRVRRSSVILMSMQNIGFDQFDYEEGELPQLVLDFYGKWSLFEEFMVPVPVFKNFLDDIKKHYHGNPYHNFRHAFDVCQMMYCFLTLNKGADQLTTLDIFVLLTATLVHDVDHNGLNNNFHMNSQSPLAVLYNDISILENHHCSFATKLLSRTENNIFANMVRSQTFTFAFSCVWPRKPCAAVSRCAVSSRLTGGGGAEDRALPDDPVRAVHGHVDSLRRHEQVQAVGRLQTVPQGRGSGPPIRDELPDALRKYTPQSSTAA